MLNQTYDIQVRPFRCLFRPSCMFTPALTHKNAFPLSFPRRRRQVHSSSSIMQRERRLFSCPTASPPRRRRGGRGRPLSLLNRTLTCIYRVAHALDSFFLPPCHQLYSAGDPASRNLPSIGYLLANWLSPFTIDIICTWPRILLCLILGQ